MTVEVGSGAAIRLTNVCPLEDAEPLLQALLASPGRQVDWSGCKTAHTAVVQVLLAIRPAMIGQPSSQFLQTWVEPLIRGRDIARD